MSVRMSPFSGKGHIEMDNEMLELFCYWIREREDIRRKRESFRLPPWTEDPILRDNHFCNVHREDDRGTKEIRSVVLSHPELGIIDLPWVYTMARLFNKALTLDFVLNTIEVGQRHLWVDLLKAQMEYGTKVFHTAYVVSTNGRRMNKLEYVYEVVESVKQLQITPFDDCWEVFEELTSIRGMGSFLAGQVIADLKNDRYLVRAPDRWTWSCIGPGSKKGLDYIFGHGTNARNYDGRMGTLCSAMPLDILKMRIHMQDLQNCLCEFSKYVAIMNGTRGRSRPYKPCC